MHQIILQIHINFMGRDELVEYKIYRSDIFARRRRQISKYLITSDPGRDDDGTLSARKSTNDVVISELQE